MAEGLIPEPNRDWGLDLRGGGEELSLRDGIRQFVVFEAEHREFRSFLRRVHTKSNARSVLLRDTNGQLLPDCGDTAGPDGASFSQPSLPSTSRPPPP